MKRELLLLVGLVSGCLDWDSLTRCYEKDAPGCPARDVLFGQDGGASRADAGGMDAVAALSDLTGCPDGGHAHTNAWGGRNGFGSANFRSCAPVGTYDIELAIAACEHYFGPNTCRVARCGNLTRVVEAYGSAACISWAFEGPGTGHTRMGVVGGLCECPMPNDMRWF